MLEEPLRLEQIVGDRRSPGIAERLHGLAHLGHLEVLSVAVTDLPRRRFRQVTDRGTSCAVTLPRDTKLFDGAVLWLEESRAIVVRVGEQRWLKLRPAEGFALELGYLAGNLHWRVRFEGGLLFVAVDTAPDDYLARLQDHLDAGRVFPVGDADSGP